MSQHALFHFTSQIRTKKNGKTPRHYGGKTWLQPKKGTVESQAALHTEALEQAAKQRWRVTELPCAVTLTFSWNGKADMIGLAETVLDALERAVYENDKQVRVLSMSMLPKQKRGQDAGFTCQAEITEL